MSSKKDKKEKPADAPEAGAEGAEGEAAPAKKKGPPMLIIIIAAAVLVVGGGGGAGAYFFLLKPKPKPAASADKDAGKKDAKKKDAKKKDGEAAAKAPGPNDPVITDGPDGVVYYTPPAMTVNMQGNDGRTSLLQVKLTFELPDQATADELTADLPRMNDMLEGFLSELRSEDIDGSQGRFQLKMEILRRANLILAPSKVNAVNIQDLLVT